MNPLRKQDPLVLCQILENQTIFVGSRGRFKKSSVERSPSEWYSRDLDILSWGCLPLVMSDGTQGCDDSSRSFPKKKVIIYPSHSDDHAIRVNPNNSGIPTNRATPGK